jgi:hypothetical protein
MAIRAFSIRKRFASASEMQPAIVPTATPMKSLSSMRRIPPWSQRRADVSAIHPDHPANRIHARLPSSWGLRTSAAQLERYRRPPQTHLPGAINRRGKIRQFEQCCKVSKIVASF